MLCQCNLWDSAAHIHVAGKCWDGWQHKTLVSAEGRMWRRGGMLLAVLILWRPRVPWAWQLFMHPVRIVQVRLHSRMCKDGNQALRILGDAQEWWGVRMVSGTPNVTVDFGCPRAPAYFLDSCQEPASEECNRTPSGMYASHPETQDFLHA
eukprot:1183646-Amphidinium_carterae.1